MQSVPITTDVFSLNRTHGEVYSPNIQGCRGCDHMVVGFTTIYMQSIPITTKVANLNPTHGEVYDKVYQ